MFPSMLCETRKDVDNSVQTFTLFVFVLLVLKIFFCFPFSLRVAWSLPRVISLTFKVFFLSFFSGLSWSILVLLGLGHVSSAWPLVGTALLHVQCHHSTFVFIVYRLSATVKEVGRLRSEKAELEERLEVLQKRGYFTTSENIRHRYRQSMAIFLGGKGAMRLTLRKAPSVRQGHTTTD